MSTTTDTTSATTHPVGSVKCNSCPKFFKQKTLDSHNGMCGRCASTASKGNHPKITLEHLEDIFKKVNEQKGLKKESTEVVKTTKRSSSNKNEEKAPCPSCRNMYRVSVLHYNGNCYNCRNKVPNSDNTTQVVKPAPRRKKATTTTTTSVEPQVGTSQPATTTKSTTTKTTRPRKKKAEPEPEPEPEQEDDEDNDYPEGFSVPPPNVRVMSNLEQLMSHTRSVEPVPLPSHNPLLSKLPMPEVEVPQATKPVAKPRGRAKSKAT